MIGSLFTSILSRLAIDAGKSGIKKFFEQTEVRRAITRTANEFGEALVVEPALIKWSGSTDFVDLLDDITSGRTVMRDETLVDSFVGAGDFFDGESTRESAHKVLAAFGSHLYDELYKGKEGLSTLAGRNETLHLETRKEVRNDLSRQSDRVISEVTERVREALRETIQPIAADSSTTGEEQVFYTRIDEAIKLLRKGKAEVARSMLQELRAEEKTQGAPVNVHFRIAANLGACALQLDDPQTASTELRTALSLKPNHHHALSYASLAAMVRGEREDALDYSERSCPPEENDPDIIANRIRVLHWAGKAEEIEQLLRDKPWVAEDKACSFVLGLACLNDGDYAGAEACLRTSLRAKEDNPYAHRLLAESIIIPLDEEMLKNAPLPWRVSPEVRGRVEETERELTRSSELFEKFDNRARLHEALIQRAHVRGLLGRFDEAVEDCDRVLADDRKNGEALSFKGQLLMMAGDTDQAIKAFGKIEDEDERRKAALAMAHAFSRKGQDDEVISTLSEYWRPGEHERRQLILADLLIEAYHRKGDAETVRSILRSLEETWRDEPEALMVMARQRRREGLVGEAAESMRRALERASGNGRDRITLELADLYFDEGEWRQAAELYDRIVDRSVDNPVLRKFLVSLFNSGALRQAFTLSQQIRAGGEAIPVISDIEAQLLEHTGHLEPARELFEQLSRLEPQKIWHRLRVSNLYSRAGKMEEAKAVIAGIGYDEIKDDPRALLRVAALRQFFGLGDFLPLAYRARRIDPANPKTHLGYVQVFLSRGAEVAAELSPEVVGVDCAVRLENAKETKTFFIVDQGEVDPVKGEIAPSDPRAAKLLGLKKGDQVVFKEGQPDETTYTIGEVQSKYVHAFQQTLSEFPNWFYGNPGMMAVDVSGNDFSRLGSMLDRRAEYGREVMELYGQRLLSIGALARLMGNDLFEAWGGLTASQEGVRVFTSLGSGEEAAREYELVAGSDSIVVEMTALLTLRRLGLLDLLPRLFSRIVVAQATVDELNAWIIKHQGREKPSNIIWKEGDRFAYQEVTGEIYARRLQFLEGIRDFIKATAQVAPASAALDISPEQFQRLEEVLGEGAIASILVAQERGVPIYVDDLGLRQVAASDWQVEGVWTQTILQRMRRRGLISAAQYYEALRVLILTNYYFVSVDFPALWWMLRYYGKRPTPEVKRILKVLEGPDCDEESALMIGAELIRRLWLEVPEEPEKFELIDDIIGAVARGRDAERMKSLLSTVLHSKFSHYRSPLPVIVARIEAFEAGQPQPVETRADQPGTRQAEEQDRSLTTVGDSG